jgi:hypothetical protein
MTTKRENLIGTRVTGAFAGTPISGEIRSDTYWSDRSPRPDGLYAVTVRLDEPIVSPTGSGRTYDHLMFDVNDNGSFATLRREDGNPL